MTIISTATRLLIVPPFWAPTRRPLLQPHPPTTSQTAQGSGSAAPPSPAAWATDQARELERELTKGNQQIERFSTQGRGGYIERSKFKYDKEWQYKEVDAAGNVVRMWTEAADQVSKQKRRISTTEGTEGSGGKERKVALSDNYHIMSMKREHELATMKEK